MGYNGPRFGFNSSKYYWIFMSWRQTRTLCDYAIILKNAEIRVPHHNSLKSVILIQKNLLWISFNSISIQFRCSLHRNYIKFCLMISYQHYEIIHELYSLLEFPWPLQKVFWNLVCNWLKDVDSDIVEKK